MAATYQIIYAPDAQKQIDDILEYYLEEHSLNLAVSIQNAFLDASEKAAKIPITYPLDSRFASGSDTDFRRIVTKNYSLIYSVVEVIGSIIVVRVPHIKVGPDFFEKDLL